MVRGNKFTIYLFVFIIKGLGAYDTNYDNNNKLKQKPIYIR